MMQYLLFISITFFFVSVATGRPVEIFFFLRTINCLRKYRDKQYHGTFYNSDTIFDKKLILCVKLNLTEIRYIDSKNALI